MGAGRVPPGGDPPVRAEVVHRSERTRVTRLFLAGGAVICKEPLGPDAERRVRREVVMLERLRGVAGVAQLADAPRHPGSVLLADAGEVSLAEVAKPLPAGELAGVAAGLARAVAGMHARGVMHRDITPANVVLSGGGVPCLVDFALALPVAEIRPAFVPYAEIAGTLAYLAPESTGRTGRPVDQRADLYALGAVLYELATGAPPFGTGDPLRLTHDHLARVPVPPAQVNPADPGGAVGGSSCTCWRRSRITGIRPPTGWCMTWSGCGTAGAARARRCSRVGERDVPLRLAPPSRLAGRDGEVAALREAFGQALAGRCRGVLVSGAPGVGKTALVDELRSAVTGRDGWFVAGKFDAYRRDLEFDGVHQALRALGRLLLAEPEEELADGPRTDLGGPRPERGPADGRKPGVRGAAGGGARSGGSADRAGPVAPGHGGRCCGRSPPANGRWWCSSMTCSGRGAPRSASSICVLSGEPVEGLLLVAAYRDSDMDPAPPLAALLSRWRDQAGVRHLRLDNLPESGSVVMVAEMLRTDRATAAGLAGLIGPHTSGNPYETVELLNGLRRDGVLTAAAGGWQWEAAAVRAPWARPRWPRCRPGGWRRCRRRRGGWWRRWRAWAVGPS